MSKRSGATAAENQTLTDFMEQLHAILQKHHGPEDDVVIHDMYNDIRYVLNLSTVAPTSASAIEPEVTPKTGLVDPWDDDDWEEEEWIAVSESSGYHRYMLVRPVVYSTLLVLLVLIGVIGDVVVILAAHRQNRHVTSAFYALLINLSLSSLVFLGLCVPLVIYENILMQPWSLGEEMCQLQRYIQYCSFYALTYSLVLVVSCSLAQVLAPREIAGINNIYIGAAISVGVWILVMVGNIPNYLGHGLYDQIEGVTFCFHKALHGDWDKLRRFIILQFTFSYALPFLAMAGMSLLLLHHLLCRVNNRYYGNMHDNASFQRDNVTMNVTLTLLFALCWSPDKILDLVLAHNPYVYGTHVFVISDVFMVMACCNAALNPWVILVILRNTLTASHTSDNNTESTAASDVTYNHNESSRAINGNAVQTSNIDADTNHLTEHMEMNDAVESNAMVQSL